MSHSSSVQYEDLFSSLISDIKNYNGKDPLLPWLRGIRKIRESLPPQLLKEKLPRFLQKCGQTFLGDQRYANDLRYVRVWIQLMDFVDDPKSILKTMETNNIGMKKSLFYQAYALYYEKMKKFESAERMYYLGVQNLAEPAGELQKSHEQFLQRMEHHKKKKKIQGVKSYKVPSSKKEHSSDAQVVNPTLMNRALDEFGSKSRSESTKAEFDKHEKLYNNDTVVVKFVDTAVVGKSEGEDARHHGLVEPTINTKEAMDVINDMFREPLEASFTQKRSYRNKSKERIERNGLDVLYDEKIGEEPVTSCENLSTGKIPLTTQEPLHIFVDDVENDSTKETINQSDELDHDSDQGSTEDDVSDGHFSGFVLSCPSDVSSEHSKDEDSGKPYRARLKEDTVVHRFVGSTILHEPRVENACHNGLVEPTINLKEAMEDINNMFGKPIEFTRKSRPKKQDTSNTRKFSSSSFSILPDDDLKRPSGKKTLPSSSNKNEKDLFEQTVCTRDAIDEINKMFGMPLDF